MSFGIELTLSIGKNGNNPMNPICKIYTFEMSKNDTLADSFRLKAYSDEPNTVHFCDYGDIVSGLTLPWMKKKELVAWLKKAADLIEKTELE